jgi:hemoglobin-like flavoprotein
MKLSTHPLSDDVSTEATGAPVDLQLIQRLRASLGQMMGQGDRLAVTFYGLLFERYPSVRPLFQSDMSEQRSNLAKTLVWVVAHLDRRDMILPAVRELGRRHVGYGAAAEHYPVVRDALVDAMAIVAGPAWSPALADDWRGSIDLIGRHMVAAARAGRPAAV